MPDRALVIVDIQNDYFPGGRFELVGPEQAAGPSRTVDSHAHRLRQKLEQAGAEPMVQTVRGVGWRLTR